MDLSKFKLHHWLIVGGAAGFFIFGWFDWLKVSFDGPLGLGGAEAGGNFTDFFFTGIVPWILVMASAAVTVLLVTGKLKPNLLPWPLLILAATALAALLLLIRLVFNPLDGKDALEAVGVEVGRAFGMILSVLAGLVAAVGGFLNFKDSGGDIGDLTDMNKLKSAFGDAGSGGSGGSLPPPPPPPPA